MMRTGRMIKYSGGKVVKERREAILHSIEGVQIYTCGEMDNAEIQQRGAALTERVAK